MIADFGVLFETGVEVEVGSVEEGPKETDLLVIGVEVGKEDAIPLSSAMVVDSFGGMS